MSFEAAVSSLNKAAQKRKNCKDIERVPSDIKEATWELISSYGIGSSNGIASANGMHTETTCQPASDYGTGIQNDDVEMSENVTMAGHQSSAEVEGVNKTICANDMATETTDEPHVAKASDHRPSALFRAEVFALRQAESRARSDEDSLDMDGTPPVRDTLEDRAVLAINSTSDRGPIVAAESARGHCLEDKDRQGNDVNSPVPLQESHNTGPGVESETNPLLARALQSLQGENEMSTTAIIDTLTALNTNSLEWLVVDPGQFDWQSSRLPGLRDTHRCLVTVVNVGHHWTSAVICRRSCTVEIYDPLQQEDIFDRAWSLLKPYLAHFNKQLSTQQNTSPSWQPRRVQVSAAFIAYGVKLLTGVTVSIETARRIQLRRLCHGLLYI